MNTNLEKYFTTGEFADLFGINKKTLFHYNDIGLFIPKKILPNGYRYYCQSQVELFNVILQLKQLNMPLKDIKEFLDNRNEEMVLDLFSKKIHEIDDEINKLNNIKKKLSNKITLIEDGIKINDKIIIEYQEEEYLILSLYNKETKDIYDIENYTKHLKYCFEHNYNIGYPVGGMIKKENLLKGNFYPNDYFFTKVDKKSIQKVHVKPAGLYVTGYMKGYYDQVGTLYKKLVDYIKDNNLYIDGYSYENTLIDEISVKDINNIIIKISIKIQD